MSKPRNVADGAEAGNQKARSAREQELQDFSMLLATRPGRRFVWRLLSLTGVFRTSFDNSGSVTAFNEGQRNIGLRLLADVNEAGPEHYVVMLRESKEASNG